VMDATVCGLPLPGETDLVQPLSAVVCVKGLDGDGHIGYWHRATDDLTLTEAQGMALGLLDELRNARRGS
jgi:hypothetical protein